MSIYFVNQGQAYNDERAGDYIWSPMLKERVQFYHEYGPMKEVKEVDKGDYILHYVEDRILAISIVREKGKPQKNPQAVKSDHKNYENDEDGWIAKIEYYDFDKPLIQTEIIEWLRQRRNAHPGPFKKMGKLILGTYTDFPLCMLNIYFRKLLIFKQTLMCCVLLNMLLMSLLLEK